MAKAWDDNNYPYRREILIQSANVDGNLTDFPLLVVVDGGDGVLSANIADDRYAFYDSAGSNLYHEQEFYWEGASYVEMTVWVKVPTVYASPTGDQNKIWIYYGYDDGAQSDAANTWTEYVAVWHMDESSGHIADATGNGHNSTTEAGGISYGAAGKIVTAVEWDGSGAYIDVADSADFDVAACTITAWIYPDSFGEGGYGRIVYHVDTAGNADGLELLLDTASDTLAFNTYNGAGGSEGDKSNASSIATGAWQHVAVDWDGSNSDFYVDGAAVGTPAHTIGTGTAAAVFEIGNRSTDHSRSFDGEIDELRFAAKSLGAAWVKFEHANINEADNELTLGSEETPSGGVSFSSLMRHLGTWNSAGYKELRIGPVTTA